MDRFGPEMYDRDMTRVPDNDTFPTAPTVSRLGWIPYFDTGILAERDRFSAWRDCEIRNLSRHFDTVPLQPFEAQVFGLDLGGLLLNHVRISAQDWHRGPTHLRDDADGLVVNVRNVGAACGRMAERDLHAGAGTVVLTDMALGNTHVSEASDTINFVLPRALAESFLPSVRSLHGHVVSAEQAALLAGHLNTLRHAAGHLPATSGPAIAQTVLDLLALVVHASLGERPGDVEQRDRALRVRLCDEIERHLGSPTLTVARLSRTLGVSRSTLYRLLHDEGGVQAYIRARRLAKVAEALRQRGDRQTIAALAEHWGFCDAAYLGRAFRETYGMTPGDYHAMHAAAPIGQPPTGIATPIVMPAGRIVTA